MDVNIEVIGRCPICDKRDTMEIFFEKRVPTVLRPISQDVIKKLKEDYFPWTLPLELQMCLSCAHIFLGRRPEKYFYSVLYSDLYRTYISKLQQNLGVGDADAFIDLFVSTTIDENDKEAKCLEIGCGDGYVMAELARRGFDVYGCDPSDACAYAVQKGLRIVRDFFSESIFPGFQFDYIYARHVLEHIHSPLDFLTACKKRLTNEGKLFIEVPNGDWALKTGSMEPFHIEHLSTFTSASLTILFEKAGFDVTNVDSSGRNLIFCAIDTTGSSDEDKHGVMEVEKLIEAGKAFRDKEEAYNKQLDMILKDLSSGNKRIAIWGAGSYGISFLTRYASLFDEESFVVVDRARNKKGLFFYNLPSIKVELPEVLNEHPVDYIVVTSQFYDEIVKDIREKYRFGSRILLLRPQIKVI